MPQNLLTNPEVISLKDIHTALMLAAAAMTNAKIITRELIDYSKDTPVMTTGRSKLLSALHLLQLSTQRADLALHAYQSTPSLASMVFSSYFKKKQHDLSEVNALTLQLKQILLNYQSGNTLSQPELAHLNSKLDEFKSLHA